jgi:hypothetical protein
LLYKERRSHPLQVKGWFLRFKSINFVLPKSGLSIVYIALEKVLKEAKAG